MSAVFDMCAISPIAFAFMVAPLHDWVGIYGGSKWMMVFGAFVCGFLARQVSF